MFMEGGFFMEVFVLINLIFEVSVLVVFEIVVNDCDGVLFWVKLFGYCMRL